MTKQNSLCNLSQTAFAWRACVPSRETNTAVLSRRWEQGCDGSHLTATLIRSQTEGPCVFQQDLDGKWQSRISPTMPAVVKEPKEQNLQEQNDDVI